MLSLRSISSASLIALLVAIGPAAAQDVVATPTRMVSVYQALKAERMAQSELETKLKAASDAVLDVAILLDSRSEGGADIDRELLTRMIAMSEEIDAAHREQATTTGRKIYAMRLAIREALRLTKGQM